MTNLSFREKETNYFNELLGAAGSNILPLGASEVTLLTGPLGVGKTALFTDVQRMASGRGIPAAKVDFSPQSEVRTGTSKREQVSNRYAGESGKTVLVKDLMDGLIHAADSPAAQEIQSTDSLEEAIEIFNDYAHWLKGFLKRPLMLLVDHLESAPAETREFLTTTLLPSILEASKKPVNMYGPQPTLVTMAGRVPKRELSVPMSVTELPVSPLTRSETKAVAQELDLSGDTARQFHATTGGLPGLINHVRQLLASGVNDPKAQITSVVEEVIMPELKPDDSNGLLALSALHLFDISTVMAVTEKTRPESRKFAYSLIAAGVVSGHPDWYGYHVVPGLRSPLHQYIRHVQPDEYQRVHEAATAHAGNEVLDGDYSSVLEVIWSQACLDKTPANVWARTSLVLYTAKSSLSEERFAEFKSRITAALEDEEFADILPEPALSSLQRAVKSF